MIWESQTSRMSCNDFSSYTTTLRSGRRQKEHSSDTFPVSVWGRLKRTAYASDSQTNPSDGRGGRWCNVRDHLIRNTHHETPLLEATNTYPLLTHTFPICYRDLRDNGDVWVSTFYFTPSLIFYGYIENRKRSSDARGTKKHLVLKKVLF